MMSGNLNSFRKRSVGLDLNQAFTEEDEEEEKAEEKVKEEEEESEKEEEDKEKEQNRIPKELNDREEEEEEEEEEGGVLSKKEQRTENHMKNQVGFLPDPCLVSDLKLRGNQGECNALFHNECMLKDGLDLSLEGKKQNYEEIESSSSRGPPESSNKFSQKKGCFTNDLELCEKQGDFLPKGPLMDGLKVRENQGESSVIPEKEYNFRDGLNLNLDERNYDGTLEGLVVEAKGSSLSPVPPSDRGRYLSTVTHDDFQVSGHRTLPHQRSPERMSSYHYTLNQSHSPIRDSFSGRHIEHNLLRSPREPSSRMHIERDISRSPTYTFSRGQIGHRDSFSRKHIEPELPPRSPKGSFSRRFIERDLLKSPRARLIERDHSRSPRDFPHTRRYRELSPPSVSPQTRRRYMRGSYSRTPPRGYRHSPRPRYSPQGRYSPRRQSPQNHRSRKRPWSPPPNRNTGIGKPGRNLFIAGFSFNTTERDLERKFSRYGHVRDVRIVRDKRSGDSRGFGFLSLGHDEDADAAIRGLDKTEWNGRIILVEKAKSLD